MKTILRTAAWLPPSTIMSPMFIDGETVTSIGKSLDFDADVIIHASNKLVIPGGIDPHTHMELP